MKTLIISIYDTILILKSAKMLNKTKHMCAQKKPKTLNNRLKNMQNKTVITIISQFTYSISLLFLFFVQSATIKTGK